ncbi:MAG: hypothetical protein COT18_02210, partial [Elusimicrobia bacterium CG08_land_8_20_14_0_20_59_10]
EKFDIRLSRIQEELEAARWEKNLLLEKMRMKELEERKNRERINELEARLKGELRSAETGAKELEQLRHLSDLQERSDSVRKIEEIKKEELSLKRVYPDEVKKEPEEAELPPRSAINPEKKTLKSVPPSDKPGERRPDTDGGQAPGEPGLASKKLKSMGQTQPPAYVYGSDNVPKQSDRNDPAEPVIEPSGGYRDTPLPGPEAASSGAFKEVKDEPLPQQAGGVVYDFTVVTPRQEGTAQRF